MTDDAVPRQPGSQPPRVQPRIGDAERDRAVDALQEHLARGRLDREEFDDRLGRALGARTQADLEPLFEDLPEPRPSTALELTDRDPPQPGATAVTAPVPAVAPQQPPAPRWLTVALAAVWPVTILVYVLTDFGNWWLFIAAAMLTYFLRQAFTPEHREDERPPGTGH